METEEKITTWDIVWITGFIILAMVGGVWVLLKLPDAWNWFRQEDRITQLEKNSAQHCGVFEKDGSISHGLCSDGYFVKFDN